MPLQPTSLALLRRVGLGLLALAALAGYVWLLRFGVHLAYPQWPRLHPSQQADLANKFQTLLIQAAGALGAGVAVWFTARTYQLSRRGQITDRFVKALEQLGSPEPYLRLGGVHALEQVLADAPDHHNAIIEVLVTFIRQRTPRHAPPRRTSSPGPAQVPDQPEPELPPEPAPDVQAALTALSRRPHRPERRGLDLHNLHLTRADLSGANLTGANLSEANLTDAVLSGANLTDAYLSEANLTGARVSGDVVLPARWERDPTTGRAVRSSAGHSDRTRDDPPGAEPAETDSRE